MIHTFNYPSDTLLQFLYTVLDAGTLEILRPTATLWILKRTYLPSKGPPCKARGQIILLVGGGGPLIKIEII